MSEGVGGLIVLAHDDASCPAEAHWHLPPPGLEAAGKALHLPGPPAPSASPTPEVARYPATGLRQVLAAWLRAPLERAYIEGWSRANQQAERTIRSYEQALEQARRDARTARR